MQELAAQRQLSGIEEDMPTRGVPPNLAQLIAAARANTAEALEQLLQSAQSATGAPEPRAGTEYLLFACADVPCAVPLTALREVLVSVPQTVALPHSPDWLLGIFPRRSEILGLVDPAPMLLGRSGTAPSLAPNGLPATITSERVAAEAGGVAAERWALVIEISGRSLAWVVRGVGDIALVQDSELDEASDPAHQGALQVREQYVTGVYRYPGSEDRFVILRTEQVLDDLLAALEESDDHHA